MDTNGGVRATRREVAAINTRVLDAGEADANEAVVYMHGNPGSADDWRGLMGTTAGLARSVAWDQPGFGQADRPRDFDYTVDGYSRYLDRMLDALKIERVHLVLHDFGGAWGLRWAADHPTRAASVVLVNTGALLGYRWHPLGRIWRTPLVGELFMAATNRRGFRRAIQWGQLRPLPREFVDGMFDHMDKGHKRAVLRLYRATSNMAYLADMAVEALRPLDLPALVLWGARDPYISVEHAEGQRHAFPSAQVVVLEGSGHWPFVDAFDAVAGAVRSFLARELNAT